jgi:hypothetical protein
MLKHLCLMLLCVLGVLCGESAVVRAQFQMPDPKTLSGIPRPVTDLPDRSISIRVVRGDMSNNLPNIPVDLHIGSKVETVKTDATGHAQFNNVAAGTTLKASASVDGERLESQEFPAPASGGIRMLLVATDKDKEAKNKAAATAPAVTGQVTLGGQSRIIIEPGDDSVQVYYLLEIVNAARVPVNPPSLFMVDMPGEAVGTSLLEGSTPKATVNGTRVRVAGPFPPGPTLLQVAAELPARDGVTDITQRFPASLDQLAVVVKKIGATKISSPQLATQQDMAAEGEAFIAGSGAGVPAGQPIVLHVEDMPHRSSAPRWTALALTIAIVGIGVWAVTRPEDRAEYEAERKRLIVRRQKLMNDLVKLEADYRHRKIDPARYHHRREELVTALEHVYGALDTDDPNPEPGRAGFAA